MPKRVDKGEDVLSAAEASVASLADHKRKKAPPSRKGVPATPAQRAALNKGKESNARKAKERKEREAKEGKDKSRWHKLLDGEITVEDLEIEELQKMQMKNAIGVFAGGQPHVPARIAREMKAELLRRGQAMLDSAYVDAINLLHGVVRNSSAKHTDRIKAAQLIVERSAGRMPETVRVEKAQTWDETFEDGVVVVNNDHKETG